jgi:uncharacterized protein (DUF2267 family)
MSVTGLDVFDTTIQTTNSWLADLMKGLGWANKHRAYSALRVTLHALRDRLTVEEVAQLAAQLPMLVRGFYYEGWDPTGKPEKDRHKEEFLIRIEEPFRRAGDPIHAERVVKGVFRLLEQRISEGEIEDIKRVLPKEIRELWP